MGIGHQTRKQKSNKYKSGRQLDLVVPAQWAHRYTHGGVLRKRRQGRCARPLSSRAPAHLVLKVNRQMIKGGLRSPRNFKLVTDTLKRYSRQFLVGVEQVSIQHDHIHLLLRLGPRAQAQAFLRVFPGQIAQQMQKRGWLLVTDTLKKLWKLRPFTRVVVGWKAYRVVKNYIQLNEQEIRGVITYKKQRLRGLGEDEWQRLWS